MAGTDWIIGTPDQAAVSRLRAAGFSRVASSLLALRGFDTPEAAKSFVLCHEHIHSPFEMKGMESAALRIRQAVENGEKITVYGDYDADGVTATALLYSYLCTKCGPSMVAYYIPERESEGYGLNSEAVEKIAASGTKLIVTVDTGISAFEEAEQAKRLGICLIVTDHHEPRETLPSAYAIVNPKQPGCDYPFKELAGVGVAFKLVCAMEALFNTETESTDVWRLFRSYGAYVCLGTVADIVPLTGENRVFVTRGLRIISEGSGGCGMEALLEVSGIKGKKLTAGLLSFTAAPRINACGRMTTACDALRLLLCDDPVYARELAKNLDDNNRARRETEDAIFKESVLKIDSNEALRNNPLLIVSGEGWHNGVIGIVASRLVELYGKPAVVVSFEGNTGRASCRSLPGFNIHAALCECTQYLERFGGHEMAAGFSVRRENYDELYSALNRLANSLPEPPRLKVRADLKLRAGEISLSSARDIRQFEPFGSGNPTPVFYISAVQIIALSPVGESHVRLKLNSGGLEFTAIVFNAEKSGFNYKENDIIDITFTLDVNLYKNNEYLSVIVKQARKSVCFDYYRGLYNEFISDSGGEKKAVYLRHKPSRDEFAAVYRLMCAGGGSVSPEEICRQICRLKPQFNLFKLLVITDVFAETGLLSVEHIETDILNYKINRNQKIELSSSGLLMRFEENLNRH